MASVDFSRCTFNIAARSTRLQSGVVKARCEDLDPAELLEGATTISGFGEDGDEVQAGDPRAGIKDKLLPALIGFVGADDVTGKSKLRDYWHKVLRRRSGESLGEWTSRLREHRGKN